MLKISNYCIAILGKMSNELHFVTRIKNAGKNRKLGFRPTVRGVAKNPVDHPHGVEREQVLLQKRIKRLMEN
jgi:large subunit ribosomal protein L2